MLGLWISVNLCVLFWLDDCVCVCIFFGAFLRVFGSFFIVCICMCVCVCVRVCVSLFYRYLY